MLFLLVGIGAADAEQRAGSGGEYSLAQVKAGVCVGGRERRQTDRQRRKDKHTGKQTGRQANIHINRCREIDTSSRQETKRQMDRMITKSDRLKEDT